MHVWQVTLLRAQEIHALNMFFYIHEILTDSSGQFTSPNSIPILSDLHWQGKEFCTRLAISFSHLYQKYCVLATLGELESPNGLLYFISLEVQTRDSTLFYKNFLQLYSLLIQCAHRMKMLSNIHSTFLFYLFSPLCSCPLFKFYSLRYFKDFRLSLKLTTSPPPDQKNPQEQQTNENRY